MKKLSSVILVMIMMASGGYALILCIEPPPGRQMIAALRAITSPANIGGAVTTIGSGQNQLGQLDLRNTAVAAVPANARGVIQMQHCCGTNTGTFAQPGTPLGTCVHGSGAHCWCRLNSVQGPGSGWYNPVGGSWVFQGDYGSAASCASSCALNCAFYVLSNASFRAAVLAVP